MLPNAIIQSQYLASLAMLKEAVLQCPQRLWTNPKYKNPFWQVAYHTLFYTHLYLQPSEQDFIPWAKDRPDYHQMQGSGEPYTRQEILEYFAICEQQVREQVPGLDLDAPSGFDWLPFNKFELQLYNIRHIQHHTGELCERLGVMEEVDIDWVGMKAE